MHHSLSLRIVIQHRRLEQLLVVVSIVVDQSHMRWISVYIPSLHLARMDRSIEICHLSIVAFAYVRHLNTLNDDKSSP